MVSEMTLQQPVLDSVDEDAAFPEALPPVAGPMEHLFGAADPEPAAELETPRREIRYERGSTVYALDGPVGTLRQIVIDEDVAEVTALVVRMAAKNESVLMPPDLVDKSVGTALLLNVTKEQFAMGASRSPRFDARMFTGADTKNLAKVIPLAFRGNKQRSVVSITGNIVQTSEVLESPSSPRPAPRRRFWRKRFGRNNVGELASAGG
jgi:hypothetical protein